jgi:hypothetical protein
MKALIIGGTLAAATALSAAAVTAAPMGNGPDRAEGPRGPAPHGFHKARGEGPGWGHRGGPRGDRCDRRAGGHMDRKLGLIEDLMDLSKEQQTALGNLKDTIKKSRESLKESCEARKDEGRPKTAIEGMDRFENAMTTRLEAMRTVKPAFQKFYDTLSDKQKKAVDDLFTRRGPHGKRG